MNISYELRQNSVKVCHEGWVSCEGSKNMSKFKTFWDGERAPSLWTSYKIEDVFLPCTSRLAFRSQAYLSLSAGFLAKLLPLGPEL